MELRNVEGKPIDKNEAKKLILSQYHVSEDIRRERRRRNSKNRRRRLTLGDSDLQDARGSRALQPVQV